MNNTLIRKLEKYTEQARHDALFNFDGSPATVAQRTHGKLVQARAEQAIAMLVNGASDTEAWQYFLGCRD